MKIFENVLYKEVSFRKGEEPEFKSLVKSLLSKDKSKVYSVLINNCKINRG